MSMLFRMLAPGFLAFALLSAPAFAQEQVSDSEGQAGAEVTADTAADDEGETVVCPSCGKKVLVGRHGQTAQTSVCPYCGKEVCTAEEAETPFCYGADIAFMSRYVVRGVTLSEDPVFQPNVWVSYKDFTLGVWGNMDLTDVNGSSGEFNELDFSAGYSWQFDRLGLTAGGIWYVYPGTGTDDSAEAFVSATYDVLLQPTLALYYDFIEADGLYATLGISHSFDIPMPSEALTASLELSAQAGFGTKEFNEYNSGSYHTAFTDVVLTAGLPVTIYENYTVKPVLSYSSALDRTIRTKNSHNDNVIVGVVASVSY